MDSIKGPSGKLTVEEFMTLHRHWIWTLMMADHFKKEALTAKGERLSVERYLAGRYGGYMSMWYGMLFGVLEALQMKKVRIDEIQTDINSLYPSLKSYRNAVFHPSQPEYWSPKFMELMKDTDSPRKIHSVTEGLSRWFLAEFKVLNGGQPGRLVVRELRQRKGPPNSAILPTRAIRGRP